jgi:signal peptidase I
MENLLNIFSNLQEEFGGGIFLLGLFLLLVGAVGKWKLFEKANQPGIAAIIPIYDVIIALRIVGRPDSHILFMLVPVFNIYFMFKLLIELVQSFGHFSIIDYIMAVVFNIFYVLNMGLAYNEEYYGPVYGRSRQEVLSRKPQFV